MCGIIVATLREHNMVKKDSELKFRVDSKTAEAAKAKAARLDTPLSQILRQLLREWIAQENELPKGVPIKRIESD
jgi:antitoxin component of RelBE/YafQ-DinJ toxin-antitoxin module